LIGLEYSFSLLELWLKADFPLPALSASTRLEYFINRSFFQSLFSLSDLHQHSTCLLIAKPFGRTTLGQRNVGPILFRFCHLIDFSMVDKSTKYQLAEWFSTKKSKSDRATVWA
jgi:hypothetical protein